MCSNAAEQMQRRNQDVPNEKKIRKEKKSTKQRRVAYNIAADTTQQNHILGAPAIVMLLEGM